MDIDAKNKSLKIAKKLEMARLVQFVKQDTTWIRAPKSAQKLMK